MTTIQSGFKSFQRNWRVLIIFTLAALLFSLAWMVSSTPLYRASATFLVYPNTNLTSSRDVVSSLDTLDKRTISSTYADILISARVYNDTIKRLQLDEKFLTDINVFAEVQPDTNVLILNVEGSDPKLVTLLANNIGQNGIGFIKSIYQVFDISFLDFAVEPEVPFHPRPLIYCLIAAGIGFVTGLVFIILGEALRVPLETLRERAQMDKQSLAFNRNYILKALSQEILKKKEEPLALSFIHLQGLDDLVDGLPEHYLTVVLQNVVKRLHAMLRGNDRVARWNNLVFSVMLPSTPENPAKKTVERLLQSLEEPVQIDTGDFISLDPVAGLVFRKPEDTLNTVSERGENALEQARQGIDNMVVLK
jgi:capsular polysaccharide biosynthesis protein